MPRYISKSKKQKTPWLPLLAVGILLFGSITTYWLIQQRQNTQQEASTRKKVVVYYVPWDEAGGKTTIANNKDVITTISPFWYRLDANGAVVQDPAYGRQLEDLTLVRSWQADGKKVIPSLYNLIDGTWNAQTVSTVINNPTLTQTHINNIVNLVESKGYDGIDIDYESLNANDRAAFSNFIAQLAQALHAKGKLLTIAVHPKESEPGNWYGPQAQDWKALGGSVDELRVMVYDYHWETSPPGAIAPISWVDSIIGFAVTQVPSEKVIHGSGTFGYNWVGSRATSDVWKKMVATAQTNNAPINWNDTEKAPWYKYILNGINHEVWFENAQSLGYKLDVSNKYNVGGIHLWRIGGEDPELWNTIRYKFGLSTNLPSLTLTSSPTVTNPSSPTNGPSDTTPPVVSILNPANGAQLNRGTQVTIQANTTDNVAVSRVNFLVNGKQICSINAAPYSCTWRVPNARNKKYQITVSAVDTSGNTASQYISVTSK